jgi:hypothetical protein
VKIKLLQNLIIFYGIMDWVGLPEIHPACACALPPVGQRDITQVHHLSRQEERVIDNWEDMDMGYTIVKMTIRGASKIFLDIVCMVTDKGIANRAR